MLVVIEGIDKSGKNTQAKLLAKKFIDSRLFSFPRYETVVGKLIKTNLKGEWTVSSTESKYDQRTISSINAMVLQCLMLADKVEAGLDITGRQAEDAITICDRYWQSAICYGGVDGLDEDWLYKLNRLLPRPDVNILIDTPINVALSRGRDGRPDEPDRYEKDSAFLYEVRRKYLKLWAEADVTNASWYVIDGTQPIDVIHDHIVTFMSRHRRHDARRPVG